MLLSRGAEMLLLQPYTNLLIVTADDNITCTYTIKRTTQNFTARKLSSHMEMHNPVTLTFDMLMSGSMHAEVLQ